MCGTVYGEMHLKDLLGSFVRVGYRIPVPDFYLVLHGLRCQKSTIMDRTKPNLFNTSIILAFLKKSITKNYGEKQLDSNPFVKIITKLPDTVL